MKLLKLIQSSANDAVASTQTILSQTKLYDKYKAEYELAKKKFDHIKSTITDYMKNTGMESLQSEEGMDIFTLSKSTRKSFDSKRMKESYPGVYEEFTKQSTIYTLRRKSGLLDKE